MTIAVSALRATLETPRRENAYPLASVLTREDMRTVMVTEAAHNEERLPSARVIQVLLTMVSGSAQGAPTLYSASLTASREHGSSRSPM